jgi:peptidoglycan/LPS O-acetylase OafA/YrhL
MQRDAVGAATASRLGYRPALDGIRAMAILAVLAYHSGTPLKGGFIGVDVFFVLSGFLITTLLLQEWVESGAVSLVDFYGRRVRRLLPALLLTVAGVGVIYAIDPRLNQGLGYATAATAVVFYAGNWVVAFARNPTQVLALLDHTWSLAIEEQFYIVWPPLLLVCLRHHWDRRRLLTLALGLACASSILRTLLWYAHAGSHIYFRSDTRADGLLLGCALAAGYSHANGRSMLHRYLAPSIVPLVAGLGLLLFALTHGPNDQIVYLGGLSAVAVCAAAITGHVVVAPESWFTRALSQRPLVWIGARSYGMYLFHIPIFGVVLASSLGKQPGHLTGPIEIALTFLAAAASYRWIESYFLQRKRLSGAPPHVQRADTVAAVE